MRFVVSPYDGVATSASPTIGRRKSVLNLSGRPSLPGVAAADGLEVTAGQREVELFERVIEEEATLLGRQTRFEDGETIVAIRVIGFLGNDEARRAGERVVGGV